jgi:hypothetical protein
MKRISLFLSDPQVAKFKALGKRLDRPYAELIREALDEYLRNREQIGELKRSASARDRADAPKRSQQR